MFSDPSAQEADASAVAPRLGGREAEKEDFGQKGVCFTKIMIHNEPPHCFVLNIMVVKTKTSILVSEIETVDV